MLRNVDGLAIRPLFCQLLNEVLSLNAQELSRPWHAVRPFQVLNEVLSLNAQEFRRKHFHMVPCLLLNEVLSLNAQEWLKAITGMMILSSSMKS